MLLFRVFNPQIGFILLLLKIIYIKTRIFDIFKIFMNVTNLKIALLIGWINVIIKINVV